VTAALNTESAFNEPMDTLKAKILKRTALIGVVGLGYVGLPFAVEKAKAGFRVIGIEQNTHRAALVNQGQSYIQDVKPDDLRFVAEQELLTASTDFSRVPELDVIVICVPTPLTRNLTPDLKYVEAAARSLVPHLRPGQLISLESTTYPGTTEEIIQPILETSGLKVERELFLVHSPERVDPGNQCYSTKNTAKVVGGAGPKSLDVGIVFYRQTIEKVVALSCTKAAELTKVFENTFRSVNIALVNELTLLCDRLGINVWEVLDGAFTKPFGIMPFYPGPGVGGHCTPIDPHYLEWKAKEVNFNTRFIALAGEINRRMPEFVRDKALRLLNQRQITASQAKILVVGVAYKPDVVDCRESPALEVIRLLKQAGAEVSYHDPLIPRLSEAEAGLEMESRCLTDKLLPEFDLIIITTDHSCLDYAWLHQHARHIFDTRNATRAIQTDRQKITLL
jgi:nucleotide sugar dehydrogenase